MDIARNVTISASADVNGNTAKVVAENGGVEEITGYTLNETFVNRVEAAFLAAPACDVPSVNAIVEALAKGEDPIVATMIEVGFALIYLADCDRISFGTAEHKEPELVA